MRLLAETGTVKKGWGKSLCVALVYPNDYFVASSNLGFQLVYSLFNDKEDVLCERAFLPDREDLPEFGDSGRLITTLESGRRLKDFDIVAFSIPFENDYPNVLKILSLSSIPLTPTGRRQSHPVIAAGGVTSYLNPEPLAEFIDFFVVGEGEAVIPGLIDFLKKQKGTDRHRLLSKLSASDGVYVPSRYRASYKKNGEVRSYIPEEGAVPKVGRRWLTEKELGMAKTASTILTSETTLGRMYLVEVGRGCGRGCRFCAAGFIDLPPREKKLPDLEGAFKDGVLKGKSIGLISPSLSDHHGIEGICEAVGRFGGVSSLSSVRADMLKPGYLERIRDGGQKTVTMAPEAGTERLRNVINKQLSDGDILKAVGLLADIGFPNIRLYFMIGLPTESDKDISGIIDIAVRCRDVFIDGSRAHGTVGRITLSINCFVPKPWTPFQWHPMDEEKSLRDKLKRIKKALRPEPNIDVLSDRPKSAHIQGLLSRGDRRVAEILLAVFKNGGRWPPAFKETGAAPEFYTLRQRGPDEIFPWDVLDPGIDKGYLWKEYRRALEGVKTPPCNVGSRVRCGVCTVLREP